MFPCNNFPKLKHVFLFLFSPNQCKISIKSSQDISYTNISLIPLQMFHEQHLKIMGTDEINSKKYFHNKSLPNKYYNPQ